MLTRLTVLCIFSLALGMVADGNAASTLKMTCSGNLTNTRADGVTLGQCDLNFLSVKAMPRLKMFAEYPAPLTRPLKINVEYERLSHPIQVPPQITGSYTEFLKCGR